MPVKQRKIISTKEAPEAIGPYSQAVVYGDLVFCAGQIPLVPETGRLLDGDVEEQAGRVLENLSAVLETSDSGLDMLVRLDLYLTDMDDFPRVNGVLEGAFGSDPPARVTIQAAGLPMGARLEMAAVAVRRPYRSSRS